jgi:hypothetical protein
MILIQFPSYPIQNPRTNKMAPYENKEEQSAAPVTFILDWEFHISGKSLFLISYNDLF